MPDPYEAFADLEKRAQDRSAGAALMQGSILGSLIPQQVQGIATSIIDRFVKLPNAYNPSVYQPILQSIAQPASIARGLTGSDDVIGRARENIANKNLQLMIGQLMPKASAEDIKKFSAIAYDAMKLAAPGFLGTISGNLSDSESVNYNLARSTRFGLSRKDQIAQTKSLKEAMDKAFLIRDSDSNIVGEDRSGSSGLSMDEISQVLSIGVNSGFIKNPKGANPESLIQAASGYGAAIQSVRGAFGDSLGVEQALSLAKEVSADMDPRKITEAFDKIAGLLKVAQKSGEELIAQAEGIRQASGGRLSTAGAINIATDATRREAIEKIRTGRVDQYNAATTTRAAVARDSSDYAMASTVATFAGVDLEKLDTASAEERSRFYEIMSKAQSDPGAFSEIQRIVEASPELKEKFRGTLDREAKRDALSRIRTSLVSQGILTEEQANGLSEEQLTNLAKLGTTDDIVKNRDALKAYTGVDVTDKGKLRGMRILDGADVLRTYDSEAESESTAEVDKSIADAADVQKRVRDAASTKIDPNDAEEVASGVSKKGRRNAILAAVGVSEKDRDAVNMKIDEIGALSGSEDPDTINRRDKLIDSLETDYGIQRSIIESEVSTAGDKARAAEELKAAGVDIPGAVEGKKENKSGNTSGTVASNSNTIIQVYLDGTKLEAILKQGSGAVQA